MPTRATDERHGLGDAAKNVAERASALLRLELELATMEIKRKVVALGLGIALALPADGRIVACDVSKEYTDIAREYWKRAGVDSKIDLRLAPATETLDGLLKDGGENSFDLAYIDADKPGYDAYYERALRLVRPNGLITIDNVLWSGDVADPSNNDPNTAALRALNQKIGRDERVDQIIITIGDGLTIARKR